jgi:hypothetical protein
VAIARRYDLEMRQPAADDHDYCDVSNAMELSEYKEAAISYIAGYEKKIYIYVYIYMYIVFSKKVVIWKDIYIKD